MTVNQSTIRGHIILEGKTCKAIQSKYYNCLKMGQKIGIWEINVNYVWITYKINVTQIQVRMKLREV